MAHTESDMYFPDFFDGDTLEKIELLGVAAAKSIMAAEQAEGPRAQGLYAKADASMRALCDVVRHSLGGDDDPSGNRNKAA